LKPKEKNRNLIYVLLPILGAAFFLWYLFQASVDVVYSDYIRIITEYLPDVDNIEKFLTPDILTRIPACFLERYINVRTFGYSVFFDRILSVLGICLMAGVAARFARIRQIHWPYYLAALIVLFSLTKWEVLLNGTCWPHMIAIGLFFINYAAFDEVWQGEASGLTELLCCIMPLLWLLIAGEYIASYAVTMILLSGFGALIGGGARVVGRKLQWVFLRILIMTVLALSIYMLSRSFAVWEHAGSTEMTLWELMQYAPSFLPKFLIKSFAGCALGQETIQSFAFGKALPDAAVLILGLCVMLTYLLAIVLYFANDMTEKSVFPLCLMISGGINHGLVLVARWIFLNENYGLSSRYAAQFMVGIIGIILTAALYRQPKSNYSRHSRESWEKTARAVLIAGICLIAAGNLWTTVREIEKAPYRKANYEHMAETILKYEEVTPEDLSSVLEWHKDPAVCVEAVTILKENQLNVFRPEIFSGAGAQTEEGGAS